MCSLVTLTFGPELKLTDPTFFLIGTATFGHLNMPGSDFGLSA